MCVCSIYVSVYVVFVCERTALCEYMCVKKGFIWLQYPDHGSLWEDGAGTEAEVMEEC